MKDSDFRNDIEKHIVNICRFKPSGDVVHNIDDLKKGIIANCRIDENTVNEVMEGNTKAEEYFKVIQSPEDESLKSCPELSDFSKELRDIAIFESPQGYFLMTIAALVFLGEESRSETGPACFRQVLHFVLIQLTRRYVALQQGNNALTKKCFSVVIKILSSNPPINENELQAILKDEGESADDNESPSDLDFCSKIATRKFKNVKQRKQRKVLIYMLLALSQNCLCVELPSSISDNNDDEAVQIEHILPRNPHGGNGSSEDAWRQFTKEMREKYTYLLANMTLLTKKDNSELKNACWDCKKEVYKSSDFDMTKEVGKNCVWDCKQVEKRMESLKDAAIRIWPAYEGNV